MKSHSDKDPIQKDKAMSNYTGNDHAAYANDSGRPTSRTIILQVIREHRFLSCSILALILGAVICSLLPPLVLAEIVNRLAARAGISLPLALLYLLLLGTASLCSAIRDGMLTVFGQKIIRSLRHELCSKISRLPASVLQGQEAGSIAARFVGDADTVESLFTDGIASMFADACTMLGIFIMILGNSRGLALLLVLTVPVIFWFTRVVQKRMLRAQIDNRAAVAKASGIVPETLQCIRTIHCLGKEAYMQERYDEAIEESFAAIGRTNFYDAIYSPIILILQAVLTGLVMLLAASGSTAVQTLFGMSAGTAVAMIAYIGQIFSPIESIGMEIQTIQSAAAGVHRIDEFLQIEERTIPAPPSSASESSNADKLACPEENSAANASSHAANSSCVASYDKQIKSGAGRSGTPALSLQNVSFGYEEGQTVLRNLSFTIQTGEQVTLTGRTGAGKSTLFKLLLGLYSPQEGRILIEGRDASAICDEEKRTLFGYVEQSFHPVPGTILDQITLFDPRITADMAKAAADCVGLTTAIQALPQGYDTHCSDDIFSQGQWQLLSIARAIAANPRILLLDEITANLDADTEQQVLFALQKASCSRTVVSISHRLYERLGGREISI